MSFELLIQMEIRLHVNPLLCVRFNVSVSEPNVWEDREGIIRDAWALGQGRKSGHHMKQGSERSAGLSCKPCVRREALSSL